MHVVWMLLYLLCFVFPFVYFYPQNIIMKVHISFIFYFQYQNSPIKKSAYQKIYLFEKLFYRIIWEKNISMYILSFFPWRGQSLHIPPILHHVFFFTLSNHDHINFGAGEPKNWSQSWSGDREPHLDVPPVRGLSSSRTDNFFSLLRTFVVRAAPASVWKIRGTVDRYGFAWARVSRKPEPRHDKNFIAREERRGEVGPGPAACIRDTPS